MSTTTPKIDWSKADEQALKELTERKAAFEEATRAPIENLVEKEFGNWDTDERECIRDFLIENADTIRDLLQPFDSGVRVARPTPEN